MNKKLCIAIISFNRPHYLLQVLSSLSKQYGDSIKDLEVYLFQDGPVNPYSKVVYSQIEPLEECMLAFKEYFPQGTIFYSEINLGVALNFDRAEKYLFEEMKYEFVLFLEDDMILRPNYVHTIRTMIDKYGSDERVCMMAAYGENHLTSLQEQKINKHKLSVMHHNWAFCLSRIFWIKRQPIVEEYLDIIRVSDYSSRDDKKIMDWHKKLGSELPQSSQDAAKIAATKIMKGIRLNTFVNNAKYIGRIGVHMIERIWIEKNYDYQILFDEEITELEDLTDELYNELYNKRIT